MKRVTVLLALALSLSGAWAQRAPDSVPVSPGQVLAPANPSKHTAQPNEAELLSHRHYVARSGQEVHSPSKSLHNQIPAGASAKCFDGTFSFSQHRRGTCSHHGGVAAWL